MMGQDGLVKVKLEPMDLCPNRLLKMIRGPLFPEPSIRCSRFSTDTPGPASPFCKPVAQEHIRHCEQPVRLVNEFLLQQHAQAQPYRTERTELVP